MPHGRESRADRCLGVDPRRKRHRQGITGTRHPRAERAPRPVRSSPSIVRRSPNSFWRASYLATRRAHSTGAVKQTLGKVEMAEGGTLFLDEIGDMPAPLQAKLLRFLQDRVIERLGGRKPIAVNVRVVCATNQDLQALILEQPLSPGPFTIESAQ